MFGKGRPSQPFLSLCPHHYPVLTPIVSGESVLFAEGKKSEGVFVPQRGVRQCHCACLVYVLFLLESPVC